MLQHKHPDDRLGRPGEYLIVSLATTERGWGIDLTPKKWTYEKAKD